MSKIKACRPTKFSIAGAYCTSLKQKKTDAGIENKSCPFFAMFRFVKQEI